MSVSQPSSNHRVWEPFQIPTKFRSPPAVPARVFSHVLYRLSYLGVERANRTYCKELGAPSVDDGVSKDTVDRQYDQLILGP